MASAILSEPQNHDPMTSRLSLCVDVPPSSSPFPSPSSSFLPPPMPGAHEFAIKTPPSGSRNSKTTTDYGATPTVVEPPDSATPTIPPPQSQDVQFQNHSKSLSTSSATTPTKTNVPLPASPCPSSFGGSQRDSLTSSRPAPPSPGVSRRASTAPSTASHRSRSSRSSRPPSTAISRRSSTRKSHPIVQVTSPVSKTDKVLPQTYFVKIRDFAFPESDEKHLGLGPDVPKPNRAKRLNRQISRMSGASMSSSTDSESSEEDQDGEEEGDGDGWSGFKWGLGRLSWQFGAGVRKAGTSDTENAGNGFPSAGDFDRNFGDGQGDDVDEHDDDVDYNEVEGDDDEGGPIHSEEGPLYPGLYRALYAFEPEGTAEMALEEDQIVRVVGRGGGVGWAVVIRGYVHGDGGGGEGHALVPESYLEVVKLDGEV